MEITYSHSYTERPAVPRWSRLLVLLTLLLSSPGAWAQVTRTLPGYYASFSAAINDLNSSVPAGGVTVSVAAGYTETAPSGGLPLLTAQGSSAAPIVFQKAGSGANPLITAPVGTSTSLDGIVRLSGADYVTFDGIDLLDPASNNTSTRAMEFGYAFFRPLATNGCQNNTIQNCTVTLNRSVSNSGTSYGIYLATTTATGSAITPTAASGSNSGNKFYANTIVNTQSGIFVNGYSAAAPYTLADQNNEFGGAVTGTGNTIRNYGGVAGTSAFGIRATNQQSPIASYNTVDNAGGGGAATASSLFGVYLVLGASGDIAMNNNTVTLTQAPTATTSNQATAVYSSHTGTGTANLNNNVVSYTVTAGAGVASANNRYMVLTSNGSTAIGALNMNDNQVTYTLTSTAASSSISGAAHGVSCQGAVSGALNMNGNQVAFTLSNTSSSSIDGAIRGVNCNGPATGAVSLSNNTTRFTLSNAGTGTLAASGTAYFGVLNDAAAPSVTISTNTIAYTLANTSTGTISASCQAILNGGAVSGVLSMSGNTISHTVPAAGALAGAITGNLQGVFNPTAVPGSLVIDNNTETFDITNGGAAISCGMLGIANQGGTVSGTTSFSGNTVNFRLATSGGTTSSQLNGIVNSATAPLAGAATMSNNTLTYTGTLTGGTFTSVFTGIANGANAPTLTFDNNTLLGSSTASTGNLTFITATLPAVAASSLVTISNNRYQNSSTASTGTVYFITNGNAPGTNTARNLLVQGNSFTNFTRTGAGATYGYNNQGTATATGTHTFRNNTITGLSASGSSAVYGLNLAVVNTGGIVTTVSTNGNKVANLSTAGTTGTVFGIAVVSGASHTLSNNVIGNLTAPASTSSPAVAGLYLLGGTTVSAYYNTVYLSGTGPGTSAACYRASTGTTTLRNNLLYNERTGSGSNYALATASTTGFVGSPANPSTNTSDYNLFFTADASKMGLYGATTYSFAGWKTATGGDGSSLSETTSVVPAASLFTNPGTADLSLLAGNSAAWYANGTGTQVASIGTDYAGAPRPTTVAAGAPDIGAFELTPTALPPALAVSAAPALGGTQSFALGGRTLATLVYGSTGTVPTSVVARYYSGTNPPAPYAAGAQYANAYFDFSDANGDGSGYTYQPTLAYDPALLGTIASEAAQRISQRNSASSGYGTFFSTAVSPAPARTLTGPSGLAGLSILAIGDEAAPLPVQLVRFEAIRQGSDALLSWTTATELDNQGFEVQVSPDGQRFRALGFVAGAGTSTATRSYSFTDREAGPAGPRYYRLRQLDADGTATFSPVRTVLFAGAAGPLLAWPNPCQQALHLSLVLPQAAPAATLTLTDALGRLALRQELGPLPAGPSQPTLESAAFSGLPAGIYVLRLATPAGTQTLKLVKE